MGHLGILEEEHARRTPNGLEDVHVRRFPITPVQAEAARARGENVFAVSRGQVVVMRNGATYAHGTQDGLHEKNDEVFK